MYNNLIDLVDIPDIKISINTFWFFKHCMRDNYFNAHIMVRMLAIDCFYGKNDFGWDWYNEMQIKRVRDNPLVPRHMANHKEEFIKLIRSFENYGFLDEHPIVVNKDLLLVDGAHRLSLALYFGIKRIYITFNKRNYFFESRDFSFDWFEKNNMGFVREESMKKYFEICKRNEGDFDEEIH